MVNKFQEYFIRCACDLSNYILDFEMSDKDFKDVTGVSKEYAREQIQKLREVGN